MYFEKHTKFSPFDSMVQATWQSQMNTGDSTIVLPDGASDVIIKSNSSGASIFFCGVMTQTTQLSCNEDKKYFGVRFKPGFASLFFDLSDTRNHLIQLDNIFLNKNQIEDLMQEPVKNHFQIEKLIFEDLIKRLKESDLNKKTEIITEYSKVEYGSVNLFSEKLNLSRRQFSENFKKYFGYDPRYFSKIKKFNAFLNQISINRSASLSELAITSGFYDQSDLSHNVKEISGLTPASLISQVYNTGV